MPTDGTLLLEHLPKENQYLVTALSVFFSVGAVLSAVVALHVVPQNSCPPSSLVPCDVDVQNQGWKYLLIILGLIVRTQIEASIIHSYLCSLQTLTMFLARMVFFRLHESPRYLVHAGRPQDAIKSLQLISRFNGSEISIELEDVRDHLCHDAPVTTGDFPSKFDIRSRANSITPFAANVVLDGPISITKDSSSENSQSSQSVLITDYASTGETPNRGDSTPEQHVPLDSPTKPMLKEAAAIACESLRRNNSYPVRRRRESSASRRSSVYEKKVCRALPRWLGRPLWAWWDQVMMILAPEWLRTTLLVWLVWFAMSLGPLFNDNTSFNFLSH